MAGSLFDRALSSLFGRAPEAPAEDTALVAELTDLIVGTVEPRVRAHRRYRQKLEPCVRTTVAYLRQISKEPLTALLLTRGQWAQEPRLRAFFAAAEDIPAFLGRSKELRAFFGDSTSDEAFALLAMRCQEKTVFAPKSVGGQLMEDVAQTTVNFTGHRLVGVAADEAHTRLEVGRRIVYRLAQEALGRILEIDQQGLRQEQRKGWLMTRLRFLKLAKEGAQGIVDDPTTIDSQIAEVQHELDQAVKDYIEVKSSLVTLDDYIAQIEAVFGHPAEYVVLARKPLRLDRMNVKREDDEPGGEAPLALTHLTIGERLDAIIALVRCPRSELPAAQDLLAQAERFL